MKNTKGQENTYTKHIVNEILADLAMYQEPQLLKDEYAGKLNVGAVDMEALKKYQEVFMPIQYAFEKVLRYEKYFDVFYPAEEAVEKHEALYHHIHSYLQDANILKNKIEVMLGTVKHDAKRVTINKDEVEDFFDAGVQKTREVFEGVSKHRDPHTHKGMRFVDDDLIKAEIAHNALVMFQIPAFDAMLNQAYKPKVIARFEDQKKEGFESACKRWVEMAKNNSEQISGYLDVLLRGVRPILYDLLHMRRVIEVLGTDQIHDKR